MKKAIRILNDIRLAFFPIAYGLSGALIGGTLNRIMIAEMEMPASLVGLFFAIPLLVSPARVWFGYRSDGFMLFGKRREPYIVLGALLIGLGIISIATLSINLAGSAMLTIGVLIAFLIYGVGRNLGHNTFQALVADRFTGEAERGRAVTMYEVATLLGLIAGAGGLGKALENYDPASLTQVAIGVAVIVLVLATFAAVKQEPHGDDVNVAVASASKMPFKQVLQEVVLPDKQIRSFFILVLFTFLGTLAQDVLLEPYGALVLGMPVGDTTRLTMFWGIGVMLAMILSGTVFIKWLGYMKVMRIGMVSSALVFVALILLGMSGNAGAFKSIVFVMGFGTGLAGAGMLTGIISFTTPIRAGMLMGVWGMANMIGHALGSLIGGGIVDIVRFWMGGSAFAAYSTVFGMEVVMLSIAFWISTRIDLSASKAKLEAEEVLPA
ncbi:MAG: BCD family MFS transporter [Anaerolineae bacterium]|jgi:BCD family chlorophyll transporter-like MFS transporter|nr:BCD family MFS transporter [Anaerolineae bacterium]MBT4311027.1 BCD family MFS transporter [Anaerolineae bacterium]MBT4842568.1 BCD family MFS transporter [Anaerolineae bacterium]MBT6321913.1 BCD family MFS transporter [Anaerolineae bacterium]MBT6814622.1 BCD family MFS transporter [Anaerolineae bacterium]